MIDYKSIDIKKLNKINIKKTRGVYFLYDKDKIVYIGQSIDISRRVNQHIGDKEFDSYKMLEVQEDDDLNVVEKEFIEKYNPIYNRTYVTHRKVVREKITRKNAIEADAFCLNTRLEDTFRKLIQEQG